MQYIDVHTHKISNLKEVIAIQNYYPDEVPEEINTPFSIGIHPWFLNEDSIERDLLLIKKHLLNKNCLAIGECGLDQMCTTDFQLQQSVFIKQLQLAKEHAKPVIVHCVKAHQKLLEIIKKEKISVPLILHGFSKKDTVHQQLLKIPNLYFSFGKSLLTSKTTLKNITKTPLERLFLETDDSNLSVQNFYQQTAGIKNSSLESLKNQLFLNFQNVFKRS